MSDEQKLRGSSLIAHHSSLVTTAALIYLLHTLLIVKIALAELTAFGAIFLLGWAIARKEARFSFHILYFPLFVYGLASTVSAIFAEERIHQGYEGVLWFKMLIFPCAVMLYREVPRLRELATYAYGVVAGGGALWGLLQFAFLDRRDLEHRISGPASHVMTYSGVLLPVSVMMLFLWWRQRKWWQGVACVLSTFTLLLTFTRSVWLGWTIAALVVILASRARIAFYALPAVILFITFMPLDLFSRLISPFDLKQSSNFDRVRMIEAGVEMIRDHPLLGVGPANVKEAYALYRKHDAPRPRPPHLHNNVIQLWAERGILGLSAYLLLLGLFLRECVKAWNGPQRVWAEVGVAVAVSLTVAGLFEFNFGDTEVFYMMLNLFALVVVQLERPLPEANEPALALVPA
ncbi:MAG TPA: O-antigen ligase family protein [Thermoanaerobaculia bacterium]|jgi:O-antigen ligase|nr:O-antigen ligase family protein [Thermoanaerobaculia bacterium]